MADKRQNVSLFVLACALALPLMQMQVMHAASMCDAPLAVVLDTFGGVQINGFERTHEGPPKPKTFLDSGVNVFRGACGLNRIIGNNPN